MTEEQRPPDNPWRECLNGVIVGDNFLRTGEIYSLIEYIDWLLRRIEELEKQNRDVATLIMRNEREAATQWAKGLLYSTDKASTEAPLTVEELKQALKVEADVGKQALERIEELERALKVAKGEPLSFDEFIKEAGERND